MRRCVPLVVVVLYGASLTAAEAPPDGTRAFARSSNAFALDLYQRLRSAPGNLVFSPASVTRGLVLAWAGARGETAARMNDVLHIEGTPGSVLEAAAQLAAELRDPGQPVVFRLSNRLFADSSVRLQPAFVDAAVTVHGAMLEPVSFKTAPEAARGRINGWVEEQTAGRIRDLVPAGGIDDRTRLVVANAVYFLGDWQHPFDSTRTQPHRFRLSRKDSKDVPFMLFAYATYFRSAERDGLKALELPYKGGALSMLFLLPDKVDGEAAVEATLTPDRLDAIVNSLSGRRETVVALPKFEVNPLQPFALGEILKGMGMAQAFDREKADFTGIADPPDPHDRVFIGNVVHKAFVRVDEKGTEAGAADAVGVIGAAAKPPKPLLFIADHPFLFLLRHNASGLVLFMGRVSDPSRN